MVFTRLEQDETNNEIEYIQMKWEAVSNITMGKQQNVREVCTREKGKTEAIVQAQ